VLAGLGVRVGVAVLAGLGVRVGVAVLAGLGVRVGVAVLAGLGVRVVVVVLAGLGVRVVVVVLAGLGVRVVAMLGGMGAVGNPSTTVAVVAAVPIFELRVGLAAGVAADIGRSGPAASVPGAATFVGGVAVPGAETRGEAAGSTATPAGAATTVGLSWMAVALGTAGSGVAVLVGLRVGLASGALVMVAVWAGSGGRMDLPTVARVGVGSPAAVAGLDTLSPSTNGIASSPMAMRHANLTPLIFWRLRLWPAAGVLLETTMWLL